MKTPEIQTCAVDAIIVPENRIRRKLNEDTVCSLVESIKKIGLQTPIAVSVNSDNGEATLIAGAHRLEAAKRLGWEEIPSIIDQEWTEDDARMWEISENLHRAELTALERDEHVSEWIRLAEKKAEDKLSQLATVSKGGRGNKEGVRAAARELHIDKDDAHRAVKVASLSEEAKEAAREAGLDDNRTALLQAARQHEPERQAETIRDYAERKASKIDLDVKERAAKEVAEILAEHIPGEFWDGLKANLYAAGANNVANAFTNICGQSIMDRRYS